VWRETNKQTSKQEQANKQTSKYKQANKQTSNKQTSKQANKQTSKQANKQTNKQNDVIEREREMLKDDLDPIEMSCYKPVVSHVRETVLLSLQP
jgi:hypothetical protein